MCKVVGINTHILVSGSLQQTSVSRVCSGLEVSNLQVQVYAYALEVSNLKKAPRSYQSPIL